MIGLVVGLIAAVVVLNGLLLVMVRHIVRLSEEHRADHAKCIAHVADMTSNRVAALHIRTLAERYDTVGEMPVLSQLRRESKIGEARTVPAKWMLHHADLLDPKNTTIGESK